MQVPLISRLSGLQHLEARQACTRPRKCRPKALLTFWQEEEHDIGTLTCCDGRAALIICRHKCRPSLTPGVSKPCHMPLDSTLQPFAIGTTGRNASLQVNGL